MKKMKPVSTVLIETHNYKVTSKYTAHNKSGFVY